MFESDEDNLALPDGVQGFWEGIYTVSELEPPTTSTTSTTTDTTSTTTVASESSTGFPITSGGSSGVFCSTSPPCKSNNFLVKSQSTRYY